MDLPNPTKQPDGHASHNDPPPKEELQQQLLRGGEAANDVGPFSPANDNFERPQITNDRAIILVALWRRWESLFPHSAEAAEILALIDKLSK